VAGPFTFGGYDAAAPPDGPDRRPRPDRAELPPTYDAAATEPAIYARWQQAGVYTARAERTRARWAATATRS
jgi:hypothetical protein